MPKGPSTNDKNEKYPIGSHVAGEPVAGTLLRWDPVKGETISIGWTANYARHREAQDGFLRGAVEVWDRTVNKAAKRVAAGHV